MKHQVRKKQFGRHSSHRRAMFRNMLTSLIEHERIQTTLPKAKALRTWAEKMITLAKAGSLHARRQAATLIKNPEALSKLFAELGPRFQSRSGGYTRVLKLNHRHGDSAPMALIEYLGFEPKVKKSSKGENTKSEEAAAVKKAKAPKKPARAAKSSATKKPAKEAKKAEPKEAKAPKAKKAKKED